MSDTRVGKRIVLATFGSLGDLHPYMAIALELQKRGHRAVVATSALYRDKIESEGIGYASVRPDLADIGELEEVAAKIFDLRRGPEYIIRTIMMPHLRASYEDLSNATLGADLLVTHMLTYAGPLVAEERKLPWVSTILAPLSLFSAHDPPVLPPVQWMQHLRRLGPRFHRLLFALMKRMTRSWTRPVHDLRRELGLAETRRDPTYDGQFSPTLNLALFSSVMALPQPDWPANTVLTGFPTYDRHENREGLPPGFASFLDEGEPPIVFTLGSSAVMQAGRFYTESAKAAQIVGRRAVLLIGSDIRNVPIGPLPDGIRAFDYAPYSDLFPRAAAIVHQGGIGTTAQALMAGHPMLVVPYGFDQPDNAARVARLGVGKVISRKRYSADNVASILKELLSSEKIASKAVTVGKLVRSEDGAKTACDEIERMLG